MLLEFSTKALLKGLGGLGVLFDTFQSHAAMNRLNKHHKTCYCNIPQTQSNWSLMGQFSGSMGSSPGGTTCRGASCVYNLGLHVFLLLRWFTHTTRRSNKIGSLSACGVLFGCVGLGVFNGQDARLQVLGCSTAGVGVWRRHSFAGFLGSSSPCQYIFKRAPQEVLHVVHAALII